MLSLLIVENSTNTPIHNYRSRNRYCSTATQPKHLDLNIWCNIVTSESLQHEKPKILHKTNRGTTKRTKTIHSIHIKEKHTPKQSTRKSTTIPRRKQRKKTNPQTNSHQMQTPQRKHLQNKKTIPHPRPSSRPTTQKTTNTPHTPKSNRKSRSPHNSNRMQHTPQRQNPLDTTNDSR